MMHWCLCCLIINLFSEKSRTLIPVCLIMQVDKAQQRIRQGQRSSMYTAEASIDAKVKGASGWRELLKLLGFRFQKPSNGLPSSVFFPTVSSGVEDKLAAASDHLHALLGNNSWTGFHFNCLMSNIKT